MAVVLAYLDDTMISTPATARLTAINLVLPKRCSTSKLSAPPMKTCLITYSRVSPTMPVAAVATASWTPLFHSALVDEKYVCRHERQKYTMTANMVPVCSMTSISVMSGEVGSSPSHFSARMTWAELETGSSSARPWTQARMMM